MVEIKPAVVNSRNVTIGGHTINIMIDVRGGNMNDKVSKAVVQKIDQLFDNMLISQTDVEFRAQWRIR